MQGGMGFNYTYTYPQRGFYFLKEEIRDILKAYVAITVAFSILMLGGFRIFSASGTQLVVTFFISTVTVGIGFVFHELAHKFMAQRYGCHAVFKSFDKLLIFAIATSFFGFIFAVPGAVFISGAGTYEKGGKIAAAGPVVNILFALLFIGLRVLFPFKALEPLLLNGAWINAFFAFFNMIPFGNFDGLKVLRWDRKVFYTLFGVSFVVFFFSNLL